MRQPHPLLVRTLRRALPRWPRLVAASLAMATLGACSSLESNRWTNMFLPYRIDVVQGNVVTAEQVVRVKEGMTRLQVREVLGTPLLADIFHGGRWDYVFTLNRPGLPVTERDVKVFFDGDKVARIEAPELPTDSEFIDSINPFRTQRDVPVLALTPEQIKALPVPPPPTSAASAPEGPQRTYPPLEPSRG